MVAFGGESYKKEMSVLREDPVSLCRCYIPPTGSMYKLRQIAVVDNWLIHCGGCEDGYSCNGKSNITEAM